MTELREAASELERVNDQLAQRVAFEEGERRVLEGVKAELEMLIIKASKDMRKREEEMGILSERTAEA